MEWSCTGLLLCADYVNIGTVIMFFLQFSQLETSAVQFSFVGVHLAYMWIMLMGCWVCIGASIDMLAKRKIPTTIYGCCLSVNTTLQIITAYCHLHIFYNKSVNFRFAHYVFGGKKLQQCFIACHVDICLCMGGKIGIIHLSC